MNCILVESVPGESIRLSERASTHVVRVLKKGPGDPLLAGIINGPIGMVPILGVEEGRVIIGRPQGAPPVTPPVDIILAMPRPKVMKRLWAPLASMGVGSITIIGGDRVESCYFDSHAVTPDLYQPRLIEGLEQVRDSRLPGVVIEPSFDRFASVLLPAWSTDGVRILAHHEGSSSMRNTVQPGRRVTIAIGPEGGWSRKENEVFSAHGFIPVSLGPRTLRTDTALIALLALAYDGLAELVPPAARVTPDNT